jgi:UPF0755 protein
MRIKILLIGLSLITTLIIAFSAYLLNDYKSSSSPVDKNEQTENIFTVEEGARAKEVSEKLQQGGLVKNSLYFLITLYIKEKQNDIQAGDYILKRSMSADEIIDTITNGRATAKKITVIEGWNLKDIAEEMEKMNISKVQDFYDITGAPATDYRERMDKPRNFSNEFEFLKEKPSWVSLEGFLYPDTYYLPTSAKPETVIRKALANFDKKLTDDMKKEIKRQGKTVFEIVTMASILEKEVKTLDDKKKVAGILYSRMEQNMPLQVDATTLYAQIRDGGKINTKYNSPYNTYLVKGLPMGPICNPGIESIEAAIYPTKTDYLFYLSAKKDGRTIFSKTFEEHKRAIQDHL